MKVKFHFSSSCAVLDIFHSKVKFLMNLTSYILEPTFLTNVYHFVPPVPVNFHKHTVCLQENIFENTLKWSQTTSSSCSDTCHNLGVFLGLEMLLQTDLGVVPQIDPSVPQLVFTITEKAPTSAFSWLKAATAAFTFKTLLRHYAKRTLTPR